MLIWHIDENAELRMLFVNENQNAKDEDQVRLIGFDAQDTEAAMNRLIELMGPNHPETVEQSSEACPRAQKAISDLMTGDRETGMSCCDV